MSLFSLRGRDIIHGVRPNPKHKLASGFDELLKIFSKGGKSYRLVVEREVGGLSAVYPLSERSLAGLSLAVVDTKLGAIVLHHQLMSPTTVHWLYEFLSAYGQPLLEYKLMELDPSRGYYDQYVDTGYTVKRFLDEVKIISEESVVRHGRDESKSQRRDFEYRALKSPRERKWYHATLESNLPSIMEKGLLPSSLQKDRVEGWSPGWNMDLQRAVYLTADLSQAMRIAETLAIRQEANAAVIEVDGRGLEDTKRLTFDEDSLRDPHMGDVMWEDYDRDFPQWVSGLESHVASIAYLGKIKPEYLRVETIAVYKVEAYARPYAKAGADPETDPDEFRFEAEVEWAEPS